MARSRDHAKALVVCLWMLLFGLGCAGVAQARPPLAKILPDSHCSRLNHLTGPKLWRHWVWHLDRAEYDRICATIQGESRWSPREVNPYSGATGLCQFMPGWFRGEWWPYRFDAKDPVLSIRVMVYILHHPKYGGWSNWQGH